MKKSQSLRVIQIQQILKQLIELSPPDRVIQLYRLVKQFANASADTISKSELLKEYRRQYPKEDAQIVKLLKKKPIRTLSGVTPLTVLTKPYPCPGRCVFCPADVRMPKSYIATEPGAQRAGQYGFDPYLQVYNRLEAYYEIGHPVSKVELIVLGGTWSFYPKEYQRWFITQLFNALNDFGEHHDHRSSISSINLAESLPTGSTYNEYISKKANKHSPNSEQATWEELLNAQEKNENAACRSVGLVLETRPDYVNQEEAIHLRRLGATKIQIGIQSLSDQVLTLNKRGHTVQQTKSAIRILRQAGFKIHAHWMPNLYGSNPEADKSDFQKLFSDSDICPDELKVYPCSLIPNTELVEIFNQGKWKPYSREELTDVLTFVLKNTPEYCRLTRIIRDIPSGEIVTGNKSTNLRQLVESTINSKDLHDIRSREIKNTVIDPDTLTVDNVVYHTSVSIEHFIQYITPARRIVAFLRLSLPVVSNPIEELQNMAIIREIHVYGQSLTVGNENSVGAQHLGLGKQLIAKAKEIALSSGFSELAVISAIGTREYYRKLGFNDGQLYQSVKSTSSFPD